MSGYATERAASRNGEPVAVDKSSQMLETIHYIRSNVHETMLRVRRFNNRHFNAIPPQPIQEGRKVADVVGTIPTLEQFYHAKAAIESDLEELNAHLSNMENLI